MDQEMVKAAATPAAVMTHLTRIWSNRFDRCHAGRKESIRWSGKGFPVIPVVIVVLIIAAVAAVSL